MCLTKKDLRQKSTRDKEGHFIEIKCSTHQEVLTVLNLYAWINRAKLVRSELKYMFTQKFGDNCSQQHYSHEPKSRFINPADQWIDKNPCNGILFSH